MKTGNNCKKIHPIEIEVRQDQNHQLKGEVLRPSRAYADIDSFALVPVMTLDKMEDGHAVKKNYHFEIPKRLCMKILIKCIFPCFEKKDCVNTINWRLHHSKCAQ